MSVCKTAATYRFESLVGRKLDLSCQIGGRKNLLIIFVIYLGVQGRRAA